jgi:hypothetical protein
VAGFWRSRTKLNRCCDVTVHAIVCRTKNPVVSASTRCESHLPLPTNASADATCLSSSRVIRRTSTFVSIAPMRLSDVTGDCLLQTRASEASDVSRRQRDECRRMSTDPLCGRRLSRRPVPTRAPSRGRFRVYGESPRAPISAPWAVSSDRGRAMMRYYMVIGAPSRNPSLVATSARIPTARPPTYPKPDTTLCCWRRSHTTVQC